MDAMPNTWIVDTILNLLLMKIYQIVQVNKYFKYVKKFTTYLCMIFISLTLYAPTGERGGGLISPSFRNFI